MNLFWLDASALAKRYLTEKGTSLMNHLFKQAAPSEMISLLQGVGEAISIFHRRRNEGKITDAVYRQILLDLRSEIIDQGEVEKIHPTESQVTDSWELIETHSINSTDALILRCALDKAADLRNDGDDLVLVSADARLVRAAKAEDLPTFNPEADDQATLDALIN